MTMHSMLTAAVAVVHPHPFALTGAQVAATLGAGGVAAVLLRRRARPFGRLTPLPVPAGLPTPDPVQPPASVASAGPSLTCRPQLLTPPGTARARGEVEQWRARGELDLETYLELSRVIAEVEDATRG